MEAPSEVAADQAFLASLVMVGLCRARMVDRMVLSSYVQPMEWDHPSVDTPVLGPEVAQSIIDRWAPFNQRDPYAVHIRDLYPTLLQVSMVARFEEYSIPFPGLIDKKSFQLVAEDGMYIRNHDFNESAELVWLNFYHFEYRLHVMIFF